MPGRPPPRPRSPETSRWWWSRARPVSARPPPSSPLAISSHSRGAGCWWLPRRLVLQRQLWGCLSAGSVVGGAGLGLASSPPPGPVGGVVEVGPRGADEGVEQASQFGHGQRDELAGSGGGAPFSAVARVADR